MDAKIVTMRGEGLTWRLVDEEVVVLDLTKSRYFSLNSAAAVLWQHLSDHGPTSENELCGVLVDRYGIDQAQADRDVVAFVTSCRASGLVQ